MLTRYMHMLFFLMIFNNVLFGQNSKQEYFEFTLTTKYKSKNNILIFGNTNFTVIRKYISDSSFDESGLFSSDTSDFYKFQIQNGVWYVIQDSIKNTIFDYRSPLSKNTIKIGNLNFQLKYTGFAVIKNKQTYILKLVPPKGTKISVVQYYYLNLREGIIAIKNDDKLFIRKKKKSL